ncbi:hypothetical protein FRUB_07885 [Fimbriiglobus ruber]|uniref:Uncharacterized protein n=1 Tax=Fimbriiglobus ruber TaxID=1908690 RepID=A0A225D7L8_9BACT|nr:hypothetical protein FRUB_07885 [Fimbriiglobus ruber]
MCGGVHNSGTGSTIGPGCGILRADRSVAVVAGMSCRESALTPESAVSPSGSRGRSGREVTGLHSIQLCRVQSNCRVCRHYRRSRLP